MTSQTYFFQADKFKNTLENKGLYSLLYESETLFIMYCINKLVMNISTKEGNKVKYIKFGQKQFRKQI